MAKHYTHVLAEQMLAVVRLLYYLVSCRIVISAAIFNFVVSLFAVATW